MTKVQTWTMTALGMAALVVGILLASGAISFAQDSSPSPSPTEEATTPTPSATDSADDDSDNTDHAGTCGGVRLGVKEAAGEVLGLSEDDLVDALRNGQTLAEIAEAQGMSADDLKSALAEKITADLQAELDEGDITQDQYDDAVADLDEKLDDIINSTHFGFHGPRGFGHHFLNIDEAAAEALGLTEDEVKDALMEGQTLAEIAEAQGVNADGLKTLLTANLTADLQALLDAGDITQGQYDDIIAGLDEKLDTIINSEFGGHHGFRGGFGRHHGFGHHSYEDNGEGQKSSDTDA